MLCCHAVHVLRESQGCSGNQAKQWSTSYSCFFRAELTLYTSLISIARELLTEILSSAGWAPASSVGAQSSSVLRPLWHKQRQQYNHSRHSLAQRGAIQHSCCKIVSCSAGLPASSSNVVKHFSVYVVLLLLTNFLSFKVENMARGVRAAVVLLLVCLTASGELLPGPIAS